MYRKARDVTVCGTVFAALVVITHIFLGYGRAMAMMLVILAMSLGVPTSRNYYTSLYEKNSREQLLKGMSEALMFFGLMAFMSLQDSLTDKLLVCVLCFAPGITVWLTVRPHRKME